jgi:N-methylhydantoinase A
VTAAVENPLAAQALPLAMVGVDEPRVGWCDLYDPDNGAASRSPVYWRDYLKPGLDIDGPAIIAEEETSTVVTSSFTATVNELGHIVLNRRA